MLDITAQTEIKALGDFITAATNGALEVRLGQSNRTPQPKGEFCTFIPITRTRLGLNQATYTDCKFTGYAVGDVLTEQSIDYGVLAVGRMVFGYNMSNAVITAQLSPTTWQLDRPILWFGFNGNEAATPFNHSPFFSGSTTLAAGIKQVMTPVSQTYQCDIHGANSQNYVHQIAALWWDELAINTLWQYSIRPLKHSEPRQLAYKNENNQIEGRWMIDLTIQLNPILTLPQAFFDTATLNEAILI